MFLTQKDFSPKNEDQIGYLKFPDVLSFLKSMKKEEEEEEERKVI